MTEHIDDAEDAELTEQVSGQLASQLRPQWPAPARAGALRARVLAAVSAPSPVPNPLPATAAATVRSVERRWEERWPGIDISILREDDHGRSFLMRMHPGSVLPAHSHSRDEESLLLEGEAWVDNDTCLRAGDYQYIAAGLTHPDMRSPAGCLVFVRSEPSFQPHITPGLVARFITFTVQRWFR